MIAIADGQPANKVVTHWARKLANRKACRYAFLDLGATSEAAPEEAKPDLNNTSEMSRKIFMFPDGCARKATKKMLLKHNLRIAAQEMNIVPGLHSALVSIPKLADTGCTTVLTKDGAAIYDDNTTAITASNPPILESNRCQHTGMWRLNLNPEYPNTHSPDKQHETPKTINVIFNLPSSHETFLWYHTSVGFPPKESFIGAVHNATYATWPKLTVTLISQYYLDSDKTVKGHLKGQRQGIRSKKQKTLEKNIENKTVRIKIEGKISPFHHIPITKTHKAFFCIETSPTLFTPTKWEPSHSLPNKTTDTSWWQST